MGWLSRTLDTTIGAKWLMGITGLGLFGFVIVHMLGNLQVFLGPTALNEYAVALRGLGPLLWLARALILVAFLLHVWAALRLARLNRAARPQPYRAGRRTQANMASRTMTIGGLGLLVFVLYHLAHFTFGVTHPEHFALTDAEGRHDVHAMFVMGFREWPVVLIYIVAMGALLLHLTHGVSSFFQTVGLNHPNWRGFWNALGPVMGLVTFLGNAAMPLAVYAGYLKLASEMN
jgi:succinate dehydrogenase / fumarate reductase cytochrome b subunit